MAFAPMTDDDFQLWLGQIGKDRPFRHQLRKAVNLNGGAVRSSRARARRFDGSRIGRGSATGRVLGATNRHSGPRSRRVVVKARFVRLGGKGTDAAAAHLRYLQRDGTTREGERGTLYSADRDNADGKAFLERGVSDRHQFRFIVAAEDGAEYSDLKPMIRRLMAQAEKDLGTKLDWVAVDHFNTGHPHTHILLRGKDDRDQNLVIAREYIGSGLRGRATDIVNLDLGPRTDLEIMRANVREIAQERFTGIDRRLLRAIDGDGLVFAHHHDSVEQSLRAGRLATLDRMGLVINVGNGRWRLSGEFEQTLRAMGKRGDIIATIHHEMKARELGVSPSDYAIYDSDEAQARPIVGRIAARGLSDEQIDRQYLIVETIDGRAQYVDFGSGGMDYVREGTIVRISPTPVAVREADQTVAQIAALHGGRYSEDLHYLHDPTASERFVEAHVRRLEAIRRATGAVEREAGGTWKIAPDHLDLALQYERRRAEREPVRIEPLAAIALEQMPEHDGITWLDEDKSLVMAGGATGTFGARVADAARRRQQWLVEQGLADKPQMLDILRRRELMRVAGQLSRELGVSFAEVEPGMPIEGVYRRSVQVGTARMALIENSHEFTLVPWRPVLERQVGKQVAGMMRGAEISWRFGRERPGPEI
jgi:type IV secretory pathway VirD2 relaxase